MTRIAFTVDGKPKGKGRPRTSKHGGRPFTPKATAAAEREIAQLARLEMRSAPLMTGTVALSIEAVFKVPKSWSPKLKAAALSGELEYTGKPDRDNIEKLVMDALNGVAWIDDAQVNRGTSVTRRYGAPERVEIVIEELECAEGLKSPAERRRDEKLARGMIASFRAKRRSKPAARASELPATDRRIRKPS